MENLRGNKSFKNAEHKNNFKVGKVGREKSLNWNHIDSILDWNQKYSDSINIDPNHTDSNQPIPDDSTNIGSVHGSADVCAIENILASRVHSPVHASPIFTYGSAIESLTPLHDSSEQSVTPKIIL